MRTIIPGPQNLWKDSYASCPSINLTVRANGEEQVSIIDKLGNVYPAGFADSPTVAPTLALGGAGSFPTPKFWCYRYVYVAKGLFPKVENAVTGGGSPAPRTNPSPSVTNTSNSTNIRNVTVHTSTDPTFSHIWIYRTAFFDTQEEAEVNSTAGVLFWIAEVVNNPAVTTAVYADNGTYVGDNEQIENDNFIAPIFSLVCFADPYYYGIGNRDFVGNVSIDVNSLITLIPARTPAEQWFSGRNGQVVRFADINSGGFDGLGSFYFKQVSGTTGILFLDLALTQQTNAGFTGTTVATIHGNSYTLYRSKPRNPLSWGFTQIVSINNVDTQVPQPYAYLLGGGKATAIAVLPSASLLKIDLEAPARCVTFNLRNSGTDSFESSLRIVSQTYVATSQDSQFIATIANGQNALWCWDEKSYSIAQCDGSTQIPISSKVYAELRNLNHDAEHIKFVHGCYSSKLELNLIFINDGRASATSITHAIYYHWPTDQWGLIDCFNVTCSANVFDRNTGETKMIVGSTAITDGKIGEWGANELAVHWADPVFATSGNVVGTGAEFPMVIVVTGTNTENQSLIGNWITVVSIPDDGFGDHTRRVYGLVDSQSLFSFGEWILNCSIILDENLQQIANFPTFIGGMTHQWYVGLQELQIGKFFNGSIPFDDKKFEELWVTMIEATGQVPPWVQYGSSYKFYGKDFALLKTDQAGPDDGIALTFRQKEIIPVNNARVIGIKLLDRNPTEVQLMNFELKMTPNGTSS